MKSNDNGKDLPMNIRSLGYVGVTSPDAKQWETFGPDILGMQLAEDSTDDAVRLRVDDRHHRLTVRQGDRNRLDYLGWEVAEPSALELAAATLQDHGVTVAEGSADECADRQVRKLISFADPFGMSHEVFYGPLTLPRSFRPGRAMSKFVTNGQGLGHAVLIVPDLGAAHEFYTNVMGFTLSDEIDTFMKLRFYHCSPRHHSLAIGEMPGVRGLHHIMLQVDSLDDVGIAYDRCYEHGYEMTMSLGRHTNDEMVSFYVRSPSGFEVEYGWGALDIPTDVSWGATVFNEPSIWGHKMVGRTPPAALEAAE